MFELNKWKRTVETASSKLLGVYLQMKPETPSCILVGLKLVGRVKHAGIAGIYHLDFHWKESELFSRLDWCSDTSMVPWHAVLQCQICRFFWGTANVLCCSAVAVSAIFSSKLAGIFVLRYSRYFLYASHTTFLDVPIQSPKRHF